MDAPPDHEEEPTNPHMAVLVLGAASLFELIAAVLICNEALCSGLQAYAVAVGIVSLLLLAPVALVLFAEPLAPARLPEGLPHLSLLLLVWWIPATFLLTFLGPFSGLSNGYFAVLGAAAGALQLCRVHVTPVDLALRDVRDMARNASPERPLLLALALSSTAVWVQAAISLASYPNEHPAVKAWAIIVGVTSSVLCAFYLLLPNMSLHQHGFAALLAVWWCQGIAISFVPSLFMSTCNGFASTWLSAFLAVYFMRTTHSNRDLHGSLPTVDPDDSDLGPGFAGPTTAYQAAGGASGEELAGKLGPPAAESFRHTDSDGI